MCFHILYDDFYALSLLLMESSFWPNFENERGENEIVPHIPSIDKQYSLFVCLFNIFHVLSKWQATKLYYFDPLFPHCLFFWQYSWLFPVWLKFQIYFWFRLTYCIFHLIRVNWTIFWNPQFTYISRATIGNILGTILTM